MNERLLQVAEANAEKLSGITPEELCEAAEHQRRLIVMADVGEELASIDGAELLMAGDDQQVWAVVANHEDLVRLVDSPLVRSISADELPEVRTLE